MRKILFLLSILFCATAFAQTDKAEVRSGNRKFKKDNFKEAEIEYRRALVKDSTSLKANYNLASTLYRLGDFQSAGQALAKVNDESAPADCHYNAGNIALQNKDYASAVKEFRSSLLQNPDDIDAKENYIYAKKMLENQQNKDENQDQNQDQQDQNDQEQKEQPQDQQPQDEDQKEDEQPKPQEGQLTEQQAQQLLNAIRAKEQETQEKVDKEKAAKLESQQKEKNW